MDELPQVLRRSLASSGLWDGEWPIATEIELLKRVQAMHSELDERIRNTTQDLRTHRLYPRKLEAEDAPSTPGRWTLRIEATDANSEKANVVSFSTHFRKATIELDPRIYADSIIEKAHHDVDGLEISRNGHTPHTVRIKLLPAQTPERFSISPTLENVTGEYLGPAKAFTKQKIVMAVWEYIKRRNLIKEDDCRVIVCDDALAQVFNCDLLPFTSVVVALKQHLTPVNSIDLEYTLSLSSSTSDASSEEILDEKFIGVDVGAVDPLEKTRERVLVEWEELQQEQQRELELLKTQETDIIERLQDQCRKREWMLQFADNPVGFMKDVAASQQADQQILAGEAETDEINVPHPHQFSQPWSTQATRLRCDPTDCAKKQQEKKDRARDLREQRSKGVFSEDHTFTPKFVLRVLACSSREEQEMHRPPATNSFDDMPIRPGTPAYLLLRHAIPSISLKKFFFVPAKKIPPSNNSHSRSNNNNHDDDEAHDSGGSDTLDNLSRKYPKKQPNLSPPAPLEPGKELDDLPIRRSDGLPQHAKHSDPCLRNSSCGCCSYSARTLPSSSHQQQQQASPVASACTSSSNSYYTIADPSLIQCEYCSRRFNDKAAGRHIAFCREKSQRDSMARGPPKKAPAPSAAAAKPTRGSVKKK
ncbi:Swi/snf-related matrix-associated actin-dependent regulator of chromatin, partial [Globisporangium splendens]